MHVNLSVTDGVYGILSDFDVKNQISALGKDLEKSTNKKRGNFITSGFGKRVR
jgi:hypothetical protein